MFNLHSLTIHREIIDESDVYIDVHKAIRRSHPAPKARAMRKELMAKDLENRNGALIDIEEEDGHPLKIKRTGSVSSRTEASVLSSSPRMTTLLMRRRSAGQEGQLVRTTVPVKANFEDMRDHFKHLGPSNPASNPKSTRVAAVKIKPAPNSNSNARQPGAISTDDIADDLIAVVDERSSLLGSQLNAGKDGKDGIRALQQSYTEPHSNSKPNTPEIVTSFNGDTSEQITRGTQTKLSATVKDEISPTQGSTSSIESMQDGTGRRSRGHVRSGSITENIVESGGITKVILEATSSLSEAEDEGETTVTAGSDEGPSSAHKEHKKKNRRKNRHGSK